jgi:acylphosphatase
MPLLYRYLVKGDVQGVGYRSFTVRLAKQLGIYGSVRNTREGDVEIFAQGTAEDLVEFEIGLRKGPHWAHVTDVSREPVNTTRIYADFSILY